MVKWLSSILAVMVLWTGSAMAQSEEQEVTE